MVMVLAPSGVGTRSKRSVCMLDKRLHPRRRPAAQAKRKKGTMPKMKTRRALRRPSGAPGGTVSAARRSSHILTKKSTKNMPPARPSSSMRQNGTCPIMRSRALTGDNDMPRANAASPARPHKKVSPRQLLPRPSQERFGSRGAAILPAVTTATRTRIGCSPLDPASTPPPGASVSYSTFMAGLKRPASQRPQGSATWRQRYRRVRTIFESHAHLT